MLRILSLWENNMKIPASESTLRNWGKLNVTSSSGKLVSRANKKLSGRRLIPTECFMNPANIAFVQETARAIIDSEWNVKASIYSLAINLLSENGLSEKPHAKKVLKEFEQETIPKLLKIKLPKDEQDILGLIYQSLKTEGERNIGGIYYTPHFIAKRMTSQLDFSGGRKMLDPCCGSASILLQAENASPEQLFGVDNDPIAVFIAKINLIVKYREIVFTPRIYCFDFLCNKSSKRAIYHTRYDYIVTNPPWGADVNCVPTHQVSSGESFSFFFVASYNLLAQNAIMRFLLPTSVLNVKTHEDLRKFMLANGNLNSITIYKDSFTGVSTKHIETEFSNTSPSGKVTIKSEESSYKISTDCFNLTEDSVFCFLNETDVQIITKVRQRGAHSLKNSKWALGVVTGNNKDKLFDDYSHGYEKIYTGKEITPYRLKPAKKYILYNRTKLQQVAKEELYRAPEKLVYKFISNKLIFAYDDTQSLFLNSANILIPRVPAMSAKAVLAFLNSELYQYLYAALFGEVKILKRNLVQLPLPSLKTHENEHITKIVGQIIDGDEASMVLAQQFVYDYYSLTKKQIKHIKTALASI